MNYATIKDLDIANGEGIRVSLFVSGCPHHCIECFNPETWDYNYGAPFTQEIIDNILSLCERDFVAGLSLLGGEPLVPQNQENVLNLIKQFRQKFGNSKNIWCYTGYIFDKDFAEGGRAHTPISDEILSNVDILVDGPFILAQKDITLAFRGSSNQRVIDLNKSRAQNKIVLYLS